MGDTTAMKFGYYWVKLKGEPDAEWMVAWILDSEHKLYFPADPYPEPTSCYEIGPKITLPEYLRK